MKWRPISEAPRDGTRVLISNGGYILKAHWRNDAAFEGCKEGPGWQVFDCEDCWYSVAVTDPTHFMPLPPPPQEE